MPKCIALTKRGLPCQAYSKHGFDKCAKHVPRVVVVASTPSVSLTTSETQKEELDDAVEDCAICYNALKPDAIKLDCLHAYCKQCIEGWVNRDHNTCPYCRVEIAENKLDEISGVSMESFAFVIDNALDAMLTVGEFRQILEHIHRITPSHTSRLVRLYEELVGVDV